ncbi:MAG: purine-binding chemotaxis protein CheW [Candidatus Binatota bacterium]|nr:purine-binding chemotaxis protein CheW [Candidatus Binatota bacterium]
MKQTDRLRRVAAAPAGAATAAAETARVLQERARLLARPSERDRTGETLSVLAFTLGGERYALETRHLREILRPTPVAPVPGLPEYVLGVTSLRGEILAVVDLRILLGLPAGPASDRARLIVLGDRFAEFAIVAEAIEEAAVIPVRDLTASSAALWGTGREVVRGITPQAWIVLDASALLSDRRLFFDPPHDLEPEDRR